MILLTNSLDLWASGSPCDMRKPSLHLFQADLCDLLYLERILHLFPFLFLFPFPISSFPHFFPSDLSFPCFLRFLTIWTECFFSASWKGVGNWSLSYLCCSCLSVVSLNSIDPQMFSTRVYRRHWPDARFQFCIEVIQALLFYFTAVS